MTESSSDELLTRYHVGRDAAAAEELFRRYSARLTALVGSRLSKALATRVDPEDVVQSAYRSFFVLAGEGNIHVNAKGDLWRLLVQIALRKVYRSARRHRAECRSVEREHHGDGVDALALSREPTPAEAAAFLDEMERLLQPLDELKRRIIEMRLHGHEADEIAREVHRSARTVRRVLATCGSDLERRITAAPPQLLAYRDVVLLRQLGQGGMGKVYRASWRGSDVPVAVKLLRKPLRARRGAAARLLEEAALLARLRHPGIVAVHGVGLLPDGGHFLVMDLVEGADLGRQPRPSVAEVLRWVAEAADALEYAHGQGIIHCDVKPSNLLLRHDGRVLVSDFGLARSLSGGDAFHGGTIGFMAPEAAQPGAKVSPRTDVFGLGAVVRALIPNRPDDLDAICRRCLDPDPERRYACAANVASALRALRGITLTV